MYNDPSTEDSDWYGYVVSDVKLTKKQLHAEVKKQLRINLDMSLKEKVK